MEKTKISIKDTDQLLLFGTHDVNLRLIEESMKVRLVVRDDEIIINGKTSEDVDLTARLIRECLYLIGRNERLDKSDLEMAIDMIRAGEGHVKAPEGEDEIILYAKRGVIRAKTAGQERYRQAVRKNDIVFAIGPAGTGKTFLAVAMAVEKLRRREVSRIVLARPAIEAGESLGFLPGDLMEKVDPYLKPLTDALFSMLPTEQLQRHLDRRVIEIVPLAYMRGRTLNDAFVILDEAQNTTSMQMKMFLTRLGINSKAIITGDVTQIDLAAGVQSGLVQIQEILKGIEGIEFIFLDEHDVVRHRLVKDIILAYDSYANGRNSGGEQE